MPTLLYRSPIIGTRVQGWFADDPNEYNDEAYESVTCLAYVRTRMVNPKTGRVLGEDDNK